MEQHQGNDDDNGRSQTNPLLIAATSSEPDERRASRERLQRLKKRLSDSRRHSLNETDPGDADHDVDDEEQGKGGRRRSLGSSSSQDEKEGLEIPLVRKNSLSTSGGGKKAAVAGGRHSHDDEQQAENNKKAARPAGNRSAKNKQYHPYNNNKKNYVSPSTSNGWDMDIRDRCIQVSCFLLVILSILAVQVICVFDKICHADGRGDPAIPVTAGNAVIPLALIHLCIFTPLGFHVMNPKTSRRDIFFVFLLMGASAAFYLINFSILFHKARSSNLRSTAVTEWDSYSSAVQSYYGNPSSLAKESSAYYKNLGVFGVIAGFIPTAIITLMTFAKLFEEICFTGHTFT